MDWWQERLPGMVHGDITEVRFRFGFGPTGKLEMASAEAFNPATKELLASVVSNPNGHALSMQHHLGAAWECVERVVLDRTEPFAP
jgi:hypothetical protein